MILVRQGFWQVMNGGAACNGAQARAAAGGQISIRAKGLMPYSFILIFIPYRNLCTTLQTA